VATPLATIGNYERSRYELSGANPGRVIELPVSEARARAVATAQERAQAERSAEQGRHAAEEQRRRSKAAAAWRKTIQVGTETHCGLLIELRRPVAQIQTANGPHWLRVAQLFAPGEAPCRFLNGRYQDPPGLEAPPDDGAPPRTTPHPGK
jgi:hypothetical protein